MSERKKSHITRKVKVGTVKPMSDIGIRSTGRVEMKTFSNSVSLIHLVLKALAKVWPDSLDRSTERGRTKTRSPKTFGSWAS